VAGRLTDYSSDVTSQAGEDGMLAELLSRAEISGGWCVELGAWDGKQLSNTWRLWHEQGWHAVLIEGDATRARELARSTTGIDRVEVFEGYAAAGTDMSLDAIFARSAMPKVFDVLSLDVDGDDYHLWEDLDRYRPRIVIVEYNSSFPPEIDFVQEPGQYIGTSALALARLGQKKGYVVAGLNAVNLFMVDGSMAPLLEGLETDLATLFDRAWLPVVYSDFAGRHYILKPAAWGFTSAGRHGERVPVSFRDRAAVTRHRVALRMPALAGIVKRVGHVLPGDSKPIGRDPALTERTP